MILWSWCRWIRRICTESAHQTLIRSWIQQKQNGDRTLFFTVLLLFGRLCALIACDSLTQLWLKRWRRRWTSKTRLSRARIQSNNWMTLKKQQIILTSYLRVSLTIRKSWLWARCLVYIWCVLFSAATVVVAVLCCYFCCFGCCSYAPLNQSTTMNDPFMTNTIIE